MQFVLIPMRKSNMKRALILVVGAVSCLSGCTMAPKYKRPCALVPESWPTGDAYPADLSTTGAKEATQLNWE